MEKQKERLVELLGDLPFSAEYEKYNSLEWAEHLADYLLANGVIVPPCKEGDYIWFLKNDRLDFGQVEDITISRNGLYAFVFEVDEEDEVIGEWTVPLCEFGKTVFLTKEEAEQALRKDEGK